jgi:hypothetical protein
LEVCGRRRKNERPVKVGAVTESVCREDVRSDCADNLFAVRKASSPQASIRIAARTGWRSQ